MVVRSETPAADDGSLFHVQDGHVEPHLSLVIRRHSAVCPRIFAAERYGLDLKDGSYGRHFSDTTPLPVREQDGRLYAPGIGDDTANVVGILTRVRYTLDHGLKPKEPVLLVLNSCEEGLGNLKGSRQIMKDFAGRIKELISFDGSYRSMIVRAVGSERWKVSCRTVGGHSYSAFGNPNAIHHLAKLISRFYEQEMPDWEDQKTTYNVGVISGGTSVNTIAQDAEMLYEYSSDDRRALQYMHDQFFRILQESQSSDASFEAELLGERPCGKEIEPDA